MLERRRLQQEAPALLFERMVATLTSIVANTGSGWKFEKQHTPEDFMLTKREPPMSLDDRKRLAAARVFEHLAVYQSQYERRNKGG